MNEQGQGLQDYSQPNFSSSVSLFPYKGRRFLDTWFSHYALAQPNRVYYFQPKAIFTIAWDF